MRTPRVEKGFENGEGDEERMTTRREEGRAFHKEGPIVVKDLVWARVVLTRGTNRTCQSRERRGRCEAAE